MLWHAVINGSPDGAHAWNVARTVAGVTELARNSTGNARFFQSEKAAQKAADKLNKTA